ncbi:DsbA family protein [Arboricoccus pini]|uniref:DsbA family protein n=1 Tax=Arboricoccus pini TaxID=1963835 RepID=UPI0013FDD99F|nr:DsbA family protein [Arboricoccus pini]
MRKIYLLLFFALVSLTTTSAGHADEALPASLSREQVEQIVKDYLMREPEVIYQALAELQKKHEQAATDQRQQAIGQYRDAIFAQPTDPVAGNANGDVTLVEFFDFRCGYCRGMADDLWKMMDKDKSLRVVFKDIPILGPDSKVAAQAALAAQKQGKYLEMHKDLMVATDFSKTSLHAMAKKHGLDLARFDSDMAGPDVAELIDQNLQLASALGINGTPSFIVGDTLVPGAVPIASLEELVTKQRPQP